MMHYAYSHILIFNGGDLLNGKIEKVGKNSTNTNAGGRE